MATTKNEAAETQNSSKVEASNKTENEKMAAPAQPKVRFDTSELKSSYCNVCNATSTQEEVVLNFGLNETWDQGVSDVNVKLLHRIIVSPHAAQRLVDLMSKLLTEHNNRYGKIN